MGNSRKRRINYKPRYTQMEAYDMLPSDHPARFKRGRSSGTPLGRFASSANA